MTETRNIIDVYHYWKTDAIKAALDQKRHNFSIVCCNLQNDFNIATVIRNANAFLAKRIIVYGRKKYDKRGTVGTHHYMNFEYIKEFENLKSLLSNDDLHIIGIDNIDSAQNISEFQWSKKKETVLIFGQEQIGIPDNVLELCSDHVYIQQYGSVRSLNVGCASAIAMFDFCNKTL